MTTHVGAAPGWLLASVVISIANKSIVLKTRSPITLLVLQMTATVAVCAACYKFVHLGKGTRTWILSVPPLFLISLATSLLALQDVTLGMFVIAQNFRPLIMLISERIILQTLTLTLLRCVGIAMILSGAMMYSHDVSPRASQGMAWIIINLISWSAERLRQKYLLGFVDISHVGIALLNNAAGVVLLLGILLATSWVSEFVDALDTPCSVAIILSCAAGFFMSFLAPILQRSMSATTFVVLGCVSKLLVALWGIVYNHDSRDAFSVVGMFISVLGCGVYALEGQVPSPYTQVASVQDFKQACLESRAVLRTSACAIFACVAVTMGALWLHHGIEALFIGVSPAEWNANEPCTANASRRVPRIVHATGKSDSPPDVLVRSIPPEYTLHYVNDSSARAFLSRHCGDDYAKAFDCLIPGAFRADLYRVCALYAVGGVYMDKDMVPLDHLDSIINPCHNVTLTMDRTQYAYGGLVSFRKKQISFMAAAPRHAIFLCHMNTIVSHVKSRYFPVLDVAITGPVVMQRCYEETAHSDVSVTLVDLGFPIFGIARVATSSFWYPDVAVYQRTRPFGPSHYSFLFRDHKVYADDCAL